MTAPITVTIVVPGFDVKPGDIVHDHDDAVVISVTCMRNFDTIAAATIRRPNGSVSHAYWGANAHMTVTRTV